MNNSMGPKAQIRSKQLRAISAVKLMSLLYLCFIYTDIPYPCVNNSWNYVSVKSNNSCITIPKKVVGVLKLTTCIFYDDSFFK